MRQVAVAAVLLALGLDLLTGAGSALAKAAAKLPPVVLTHGGAGSPRKTRKDGTDKAATAALAVLKRGGSALDAALAGTVVLEDDPRFNAGTGSNIRMDGKTIQMDAACMDGATGRYGAVAALERVRNPVLVARQVMDTPHILIVGEGATRFARAMGHADYDPTTPQALDRYREVKKILAGQGSGDAEEAWRRYDWRKAWNFPTKLKDVLGSPDTVGCIARDGEGRYAAAISTGGTAITFYGRVGDVPIYGAGIYAGPKGAVACTGTGEEIVKKLVAKGVYDRLAKGEKPQAAVNAMIASFPKAIHVGIIAVNDQGEGGGCNYGDAPVYADNMAWSIAK